MGRLAGRPTSISLVLLGGSSFSSQNNSFWKLKGKTPTRTETGLSCEEHQLFIHGIYRQLRRPFNFSLTLNDSWISIMLKFCHRNKVIQEYETKPQSCSTATKGLAVHVQWLGRKTRYCGFILNINKKSCHKDTHYIMLKRKVLISILTNFLTYDSEMLLIGVKWFVGLSWRFNKGTTELQQALPKGWLHI